MVRTYVGCEALAEVDGFLLPFGDGGDHVFKTRSGLEPGDLGELQDPIVWDIASNCKVDFDHTLSLIHLGA